MTQTRTGRELRAMAYRLIGMADAMEGVAAKREFLNLTSDCPTPKELAAEAARIYAGRRQRETVLPASLLGEPAWDMLLDLFTATVEGKQIASTSAYIASQASNMTAHRYVAELEKAGIVRRVPSVIDRRTIHLELTAKGVAEMTRVLSYSILGREARPVRALDAYLREEEPRPPVLNAQRTG